MANAETHWKNISSNNSNGSPQDQNELPIYTLPGVINYLTSEFTNLERFKIVTNLEKSEMKYKIVHLQGELTSLKFINQKQQTRINALEKENALLRANIKGEAVDTKDNDDDNGNDGDDNVGDNSAVLSEVGIQQIKESKERLKTSTKEIITLLKQPTPLNLLNLPREDENEFEPLLIERHAPPATPENSNSNSVDRDQANNVIAEFFSDDSQDFLNAEKTSDEKVEQIKVDDDLDVNEILERAITNESDDITVIVDEEENDVADTPEQKTETKSKRKKGKKKKSTNNTVKDSPVEKKEK
ncbi:uncharacterized protein LODBEIA_P19070 [Lodderomyces beijingensis]|uniref:Striatin N-terminal domain-containing protein n=1 Tax=Lodderomyces beijingensis TaxID=1775926 RepID=A0ABP0ZJ65_9ASCO